LALSRRYPSRGEYILVLQGNLANCLDNLGRRDEALVLEREIYARQMAVQGLNKDSIISGLNLAASLGKSQLWDEAKALTRDRLLPAALQLLGADHHLTLTLNLNFAGALAQSPERTRDDLLEAETIMQDNVQRRRQVFGPAHPETLHAEAMLSQARALLAQA